MLLFFNKIEEMILWKYKILIIKAFIQTRSLFIVLLRVSPKQ